MKTETQEPTKNAERPLRTAPPQVPLDSSALLGTQGEVEIIHQGETYRLRRTRQGKLILTK
jgi:hemin uptake protein HemP